MARKTKPRKKYVVKTKMISAIRNLTKICPMKNDILKAATKQEQGVSKNGKIKMTTKWECNHCKILFPKSLVCVDHIQPIVPVDVHPDLFSYDRYIINAFYGFTEYNGTWGDIEILKQRAQVLCLDCHAIKTGIENAERTYFKQLLKEKTLKGSREDRLKDLIETSLIARKAEAEIKRITAIQKYGIENAKRREEINPIDIMKEYLTEERLKKLAEKEVKWKEKKLAHQEKVAQKKKELNERRAKEAKEVYDKHNKE